MSKKPGKAVANPHQSVAPEEAKQKGVGRSQPGHTGDGLTVNPVSPGGIESVEGYKSREVLLTMDAPPIGELSFGKTRRIHGTDDRVQINNTNQYPWSAIVSLYIESPAGNGIGTGFFIGPKTIATCGHCVYIRPQGNPSGNTWATRITVMPGRNDSAATAPGKLPFGSVVAPRSGLRSVTGWIDSGDNQFDYGVITLDTELGQRTGWFGFGVYTDAQLKAMTGNLSGYPGDKGGGTQWFDSDPITNIDARRVYYRIDMLPGHSGSPVFAVTSQGRYAFAINAYSWDPNFGTRINSEVSANLVSWKG
jgi:glutamyl endopeptidase